MSHRLAPGTQIFGYTLSLGRRSIFESVDRAKPMALPEAGEPNPLWANELERAGEEDGAPSLPARAGPSLLSLHLDSDWTVRHPPALRWRTLALLSLHCRRSQFLAVHLFTGMYLIGSCSRKSQINMPSAPAGSRLCPHINTRLIPSSPQATHYGDLLPLRQRGSPSSTPCDSLTLFFSVAFITI